VFFCWGGGVIKNLGPSHLGTPSKFFGKYWEGGGRPQNFFQSLGLHNGGLNVVFEDLFTPIFQKIP
jgi:hypothetical protein